MATRTLAYRIGVEGREAAVGAQREIADSAEANWRRASSAAERASQIAEAAIERARQKAAAAAQYQPSATAQRINDVVGISGGGDKSARDSAVAIAAAMEEEERRARALKAAIDPLWAAQQRLAQETENADQLLRRGAITQQDHAAAVALAKRSYDVAEQSVRKMGAGQKVAAYEAVNLSRQMADVGVSLAGGISPMMVLMQQGPQVADVFQTMTARGVGLKDMLISLAATAAPMLIALGAIQALSAAFEEDRKAADFAASSSKGYAGALNLADEAVRGLTISTFKLADARREAARAAIQEQIAANNARAEQIRKPGIMASIGQALTRGSYFAANQRRSQQDEISNRNASLLGEGVGLIFGPQAVTADVRDAADKLNPQRKQIEEIQQRQRTLREALNDAGKMPSGYTPEQLRADLEAGDRQIKQLQDKASGRDKHAESLGREAAAMDANARAALSVADAYLKDETSGMRAEAMRKGLTDATRKGIDVAAEMRRQLALQVAEEAAQGAKSAADIGARVDAQKRLDDAVAAGTITSQEAQRQLQVELALRPLLAAQKLAEGEAAEKLRQVIERLRQAYAAEAAEQARGRLQQGVEAARDRIAALQLEARYVDDLTGARERALAVLKLQQSADYKTANDPAARAAAEEAAKDEADQSRATRLAQYLSGVRRSQADQLGQTKLELTLVRASNEERDRQINRLRLIQDLKAQGVDLSSEEARQILAQSDALDAVDKKLRVANEDWAEFSAIGERLIDDILDPSAWDDWGNVGKRVLQDLLNEFVKLAVANPLKNALFGSALPGLGGVLGGLFGGGSSAASYMPEINLVGQDLLPNIFGGLALPFFADGTPSAPGGWSVVGEEGPELVNLPRGSQVFSNDQSRRLTGAPSVSVSIDARGAGPREVDELRNELAGLKRELPGLIVSVSNDATQRRLIRR